MSFGKELTCYKCTLEMEIMMRIYVQYLNHLFQVMDAMREITQNIMDIKTPMQLYSKILRDIHSGNRNTEGKALLLVRI